MSPAQTVPQHFRKLSGGICQSTHRTTAYRSIEHRHPKERYLKHSLEPLPLLTVPRQILLRRDGISRRYRNQSGEPILRQEHQPRDEDERGGQHRHPGGFQKDAE